MKKITPSHLILLAGVIVVLAWSAWQPYGRLTWWLEVLPALATLVVLFATYRRFEFTTLTYTLIALHMCVLFVGGHYTYARVPLFDWLRPIFGWHRNHYDRLGHIMQGFVPAIVTREVFLRLHILKRTSWQRFLVVCVCLAISALYELIEWWTALLSGDAAIMSSYKARSEEHTSELQSQSNLVCRLLLEKKKEIENVSVAIRS